MIKAALGGKTYRGNIPFSAATTATVNLPQGMGGTDYSISVTPIAANAAAMPAKFGITGKDSASFNIVTDAAFTGSFDVIVQG